MTKSRVNWGRLEDGNPVILYRVANTSRQKIYVLARDKPTAMSIALAANHVYGTKIISSDYYCRDAFEMNKPFLGELSSYADSIELAIAQNFEGTLHLESGILYVGYEAIKS